MAADITANYTANSVNLANSTLTTNFDVSPYYDDYDYRKNYHRILFKPGYAVQARELTQLQTILQKQIDRFGKHVFKEGSIVLPGAFTLYSAANKNAIPYIKIKDKDNNGNDVTISNFLNQRVISSGNNITAFITDVLDGVDTTANTKTIYVKYETASNVNSSYQLFSAGETLVSNVGNLVVIDTNPTGKGSKFRIEEGVFFAKEHFISFPTQSVILDRYNDTPSCKVGFFVTEEIVNYTQDSTLLDPALESSNYSAPGADRLKLNPELMVLPFEDPAGPPDFVTLFTIKGGIVQSYYERSQYNVLQTELAKRTYDESGDYYVNGLNIQIREHLDDGTNFGKYSNAAGGLANSLFVGVSPGTCYVKGYEVNLLDTEELVIPKSTAYSNVNSQTVAAVMGSYFRTDEYVGSWELDKGNVVDLYDQPSNRISGGTWSSVGGTGNKIGTARLISTEYINGYPGLPTAQYDIYLTDIRVNSSNTLSQVKSLYFNSSSNPDGGADVVLEGNRAILKDVNQPLLFYTGSDYTRKVRTLGNDSTTDTTFNYLSTSTVSISGGTFTITLTGTETFPYGTVGDISSTNKKAIQVAMGSSFNIAGSGTVTGTAGSTTLTGSGTYFTRMNPGDKIEVTGKANVFFISAIASDTSLTVTNPLPAGVSGNTWYKAWKAGDIFDLSGKGFTAGADRTVAATESQLTFDLKEAVTSSATVNYPIQRANAFEVLKTLKPNRVVKINTATAGATGPYSLGFSDVYQIRSITLSGSDVTSSFSFDNGQRDTHYELASISPVPGYTPSGEYTVTLDYFLPDYSTGYGYYSIDSYPIDDASANLANDKIRTEDVPYYNSPTTGGQFDLRNYIDFRPVKAITATDTTVPASATTNPANTSSFNATAVAAGMRMVAPSSQITFDYSYYLGRKDLVLVNTRGNFYIESGIPGVIPITPVATDENSLVLGIINVMPFPSISPAYARSLGKRKIASTARKIAPVRYTMRDIGVLKDRIVNLEYYASLSLLEKQALDLRVVDEYGLDRFKNGVFVDSFNDHYLGALGSNPDYRIVVDENEKSIRPYYTFDSYYYKLASTPTNITQVGSVLMLNYTETSAYSQPRATSLRNIERTSYLFYGVLTLVPDQDVWVDTKFIPDEQIDLGSTVDLDPDHSAPSLGITWGAWQKYITGYKVYKRGASQSSLNNNDNDWTLVGTYTTYDEAKKIAAGYRATNDIKIETVYNNTRSGVERFQQVGNETDVTGEKVVNVQIIPYMRPQNIKVFGRGLKPFSRLFTFFDGEPVSQYVTPLTANQYTILTDANANNDFLASNTGIEGTNLTVDANGRVYFAVKVGGNNRPFTTGTKRLRVTDSNTGDEDASSTGAETPFYSEGLSVTKQRTVFTTHPTAYREESRTESYISTTSEFIPMVPPPPPQNSCFDPNALVTMADGSLKRIADVVIGDKVLSGNGKTINNVLGIEEVALTNRKMYKFNNTWAFVSEEHPIMTSKGWAAFNPTSWAVEEEFIGKLELIDIGTSILKSDGSYETVESISDIEIDEDYLIYNLMLDGDHTYIVENYVVHNKKSCLAYSFLAKAPADEDGMFLTSVDLFIAQKDPSLDIWFEVREMNSAGGITRNTIPKSEVWYSANSVPISTDGKTNPLHVTFPEPLFLMNNQQYAFVIHTENVSPNYYLWTAKIGENDVNTGNQYTSRPLSGTLFTTNNNLNWDIVPDTDLTCNFYRAVFNPAVSGYVEIGVQSFEKFRMSNIQGDWRSKIGDTFYSGARLTLSGANGSISIGQRLRGNVSTQNANVQNIISTTYYTSNVGFVVGEKVDVYHANGVYSNVSATVASTAYNQAKLQNFIQSSSTITAYFVESSGGFKANDVIMSYNSGPGYRGTIDRIDNQRYSTIDFRPSAMQPIKTSITYEMKTTSNTGVDQGYSSVIPEEIYSFDKEMAVFSRSNSTDVANKVKVYMSTQTEYASPVLNVDRTHSVYVDNIVNSNTVGENAASGGALYNKYISRTVTLAEGQDAEDMLILATAYRPPGTDVKMWAKILNADDSDSFDKTNWIPLEMAEDGELIYSSLSKRDDWKEYKFSFPAANTDNNVIYYTNSNGTTFRGYKYFALKIGLLANNSAIIPRVADLRAIALQS